MYERLKGFKSFWYPYLEIVEGMDLLMFWNDDEMDELQDIFLKNQAKKMLQSYRALWKDVYKVIKKYPGFFPGTEEELESVFRWSYELVIGRSFGEALPCSMLVPLADNLNHANVNVTYQLLHKKIHLVENKPKYQDFKNEVKPTQGNMIHRYGTNRLQKFLETGNTTLTSIKNIWELDKLLNKYETSTDEEDNCTTSSEEDEEDETSANGSEEEEEEDESEDEDEKFSWYDWNDKENIFFTILTGARNSYEAGSEIFNCYGRRNNRFLLLHYGFTI